MALGIKCTCCQADITAPQFHNGKPYGWTCILKVKPNAKRSKKSTWIKADEIIETVVGLRIKRVAVLNGLKYVAMVLVGSNGIPASSHIQGGLIQVINSEGKLNFKSLKWKEGNLLDSQGNVLYTK